MENSREQASLGLWLQLMKCTKTIEAQAAGHLRKEHGQSLARFDVLSQLHRFGEAPGDYWVSVGTIANNVMTSSGNITALLDRMEAEDLIERRASPTDRRGQQIRVTTIGRDIFSKMSRDHAEWVDNALGGISVKDREQLTRLLIKTRRAFETGGE